MADPLATLAAVPSTKEAVQAARDACTELRWHPALRRRTREARAEATVRASRASAALEGARYPVSFVRDVIRGRAVPDDLSGTQLAAAVRVGALAEEFSEPGSVLAQAPLQALAQLHVGAATGLIDAEQVGRPRSGDETPQDMTGMPAAPQGDELNERLQGLGQLLCSTTAAPAIVPAAVAHGEILAMRPFVLGNGLVARAVFRALIIARGVDPIGVVVPEAAFLSDAGGYSAAGLGYARGHGVTEWIDTCARAVADGAAEGTAVANAVMAGKAG